VANVKKLSSLELRIGATRIEVPELVMEGSCAGCCRTACELPVETGQPSPYAVVETFGNFGPITVDIPMGQVRDFNVEGEAPGYSVVTMTVDASDAVRWARDLCPCWNCRIRRAVRRLWRRLTVRDKGRKVRSFKEVPHGEGS
jgi:hypothetical protein